jgi:hypothetical protein
MTTPKTPTAAHLGYLLLTIADVLHRAACKALSLVSPVTDGGVFYVHGGTSFVDCWREWSDKGGSLTLRLGRIEVITDHRAPRQMPAKAP